MLLDALDRTEEQLASASGYREKYHEADKEKAVLLERLKTRVAVDILFGTALAVGSALLGIAPFLWSTQPGGWLSLVIGGILVGGGVTARVMTAK